MAIIMRMAAILAESVVLVLQLGGSMKGAWDVEAVVVDPVGGTPKFPLW
jgi:hypothetical protein